VHLLVAAYVGYQGSGTISNEYGRDARELAGEFATVNMDDDPVLRRFKYDPDNLLNFDVR